MKNLTERIKDFFTAFWTWLTYSRVSFRYTEEYVNGYEDFLTEYCRETMIKMLTDLVLTEIQAHEFFMISNVVRRRELQEKS